MRRKDREKEQVSDSSMQAFAEEYLTPKNVLVGLGVASLAGVAAYSTARALKNEKIVNRIKKELNFDSIKSNINSGLGKILGKEKKEEPKENKPAQRSATKSNRSSRKSPASKPKGKKRYVTG